MTSRLDRLFMLLESGSSPATRKAAAQQLGEVQRLHPHELYTLLGRIHICLQNPQWEARIAASQAVEAVVNQVPKWAPKSFQVSELPTKPQAQLKLCNVDIRGVLQRGHSLMGADSSQYDVEDTKGLDIRERLSRQRALLNKRLGLDLAQQMGIDTSAIVCNDDLVVQGMDQAVDLRDHKQPDRDIGDMVEQEVSSVSMSSRERNRARRKARLLAKQQSRDAPSNSDAPDQEERQPAKKRKLSVLEDPFKSSDCSWQESGEWPFEIFCEQLCTDIFSPTWESRHGAAVALREVIRIHGKGAGRTADISDDMNEVQHQEWLEDVALRLVFVLALDHFGDFISDQVVAPVREAVAQVLGSVVNLMQYESIQGLLNVLLQLLNQSNWETRHGGLLGIKYLLAVSKDHVEQILPVAYPYLYASLSDTVDDVSAVAASALVPVALSLTQLLPLAQVSAILSKLWDSLLDLDDVTVSTKSIMQLLASVLTHTDVSSLCLDHSMVDLIPRLWPFLYHSSSSVRKAVLQTLLTLFNIKDSGTWLGHVIDPALRHVFQRAIMESHFDICILAYEVFKLLLEKTPLTHVFFGSCPYIASWLCLLMTPSKVHFDPALLILCPKHHASKPRMGNHHSGEMEDSKEECKYYMGGNESLYSSNDRSEELIWRSRQMGAQILGLLSCYITQEMSDISEDTMDSYSKLLMIHLESKSAIQKQCVALVLSEWARHLQDRPELRKAWPEYLVNKLHQSLVQQFYYDEIAVSFTRLQSETRDYLATLRHYSLPLDDEVQNCQVFTFEHIHGVVTKTDQILKSGLKLKQKVIDSLEERRKNIYHSSVATMNEQTRLHLITQACIASAVVSGGVLPDKLNPVIRPIMDSVKTEEVELLQRHSAQCLSLLMDSCMSRVPCPNVKISKNLTNYLSCDTDSTPHIVAAEQVNGADQTSKVGVDLFQGILTLTKQAEVSGKYTSKRGHSSKNQSKTIGNLDSVCDDVIANAETAQANAIERRGAELAFQCLGRHFAEDLPEKLPYLWSLLTSAVSNTNVTWTIVDASTAQVLVYNLRLLETMCPDLHESLHDKLITHLGNLIQLLENPFSAVRHMVSRVLASLCQVKTVETMLLVSKKVLPMLGCMNNDIQRKGAIEALHCIMETLGIQLVPYITLFIVPILGAISDPECSVRLLSTQSFANLVRLMPLDGGIPEVPNISESLMEQKINQKHFLDQLFNINHVDDYKIPVPIKAELRRYQQHGINWLAFLNKYKLHGILCDDMGLGKTLQSICILASDHYYRNKEYQCTGNVDCYPLPSLVICPPTLVGHWVYEVERFVDPKHLKPLLYSGPPADRQRLRNYVDQYNLIVASYDIVRNDINFFGSQRWNYCILDEGHIIKNGKTKMSRAIKQLIANHRLILSGTPIQNNVLELWSLFDFLMPGYLGTERQFNGKYSRPILQSRDAKTSSREQEAGALALESLHRQVLPLLLRRMKEDVLQDLPPKITQDYYCDLSPLQVKLYEDFARSRAKQTLEDTVKGEQKSQTEGAPYVFQALQYLRKVCNHPKLVLNSSHCEYSNITQELHSQHSSLEDINHAAKLPALKQLLLDCGIGVSSSPDMPAVVVNQHRALIFCQLKSMLDIVENDLLRAHMPEVTYSRLDGSVPSNRRHSIVTRFNNDPSIDVLLLTTQVGGLGLNLTGADTVIFVEHDWNPMKDVQAMDRAHRIGQKKVVNVYRLITKGTLEEKIMGLQKFKLATANTVINQENSSLYTMGTDQLLELFTLNDKQKSSRYANSQDPRSKGVKAILDNLPELWDERQYEDEYDLTAFLSNLTKK